jgi:hypothetical protein
VSEREQPSSLAQRIGTIAETPSAESPFDRDIDLKCIDDMQRATAMTTRHRQDDDDVRYRIAGDRGCVAGDVSNNADDPASSNGPRSLDEGCVRVNRRSSGSLVSRLELGA